MTYRDDPVPAALGVLVARYPAFTFAYARIGRRDCRWIAERKDGLSAGLHTMITADLDELSAALNADRSCHDR